MQQAMPTRLAKMKMPERDNLTSTAQQGTVLLRRSPRFLHPKATPETQKHTKTRRRRQSESAAETENSKTPKSKLNNTPESEQPATTTPGKSQRLVKQKEKERAAQSENPNTTPNSKSGSRIVVCAITLSTSFKKSRKSSDGSREIARSSNGGNMRNGSRNSAKLSSGSRRSSRLNNVADGFQSSTRQSSTSGGHKNLGGKHNNDTKSKISLDKVTVSGVGKDGTCVSLGEKVSKKSKRVTGTSSYVELETVAVEGGKDKAQELDCGKEQVGVGMKRKRAEQGDAVANGWTKEQELALQRAYLLAKPTPDFWKQVSTLVPGKSAQDCFDRVHSDHITPPQPGPRSRAKITSNSSPLGEFELSASKLLKPLESKANRPGCNKQRSHLAHKTVRALLKKHHQVHQEFEADLFSVLEPNLGSSTEIVQPSVVHSTPTNSQIKQGFLRKSGQISTSGHKKPLSRFSNSCGSSLVSPPVLKRVKNKVLHEKYIDQLHVREAKRKTVGKNNKKSTVGIQVTDKSHIQKVDVRAAKLALFSDATDAIDKLRHLQADAKGNSSESDNGGIANYVDDEEDEDDTF